MMNGKQMALCMVMGVGLATLDVYSEHWWKMAVMALAIIAFVRSVLVNEVRVNPPKDNLP